MQHPAEFRILEPKGNRVSPGESNPRQRILCRSANAKTDEDEQNRGETLHDSRLLSLTEYTAFSRGRCAADRVSSQSVGDTAVDRPADDPRRLERFVDRRVLVDQLPLAHPRS